jgi:hypothetical protein
VGLCLTLLDNTQLMASTVGGDDGEDIERSVVSGTVLIGDSHLDALEDCKFNRVSLRLTNLDQWINRSPFKWSRTSTESLEALNLPTLQATAPGCEILLYRRTSSHHGWLNESGYRSHEVIELRLAERHPLDELEYRFVRPLEQLLTLAAGSHCEVLELNVGTDDPSVPTRSAWPYVSYAVRRRSSDTAGSDQPVIRQNMRFGMNCAEYPPNIDFGVAVPRWFALQESLSSVCDLIFSVRTGTDGYLEQQMFTIASAIEGLHRGLNPELRRRPTMNGTAIGKSSGS